MHIHNATGLGASPSILPVLLIVPRSGNVVLFNVPGRKEAIQPGLVLTAWRNGKKPKVSTSALAVQQCLAFRVVELQQSSKESDRYICGSCSAAWVVRLEALLCILDVQASDTFVDSVESFSVRLTPASLEAVNKARSLAGWEVAAPEQEAPPVVAAESVPELPRSRFQLRRFGARKTGLPAAAKKAAGTAKRTAKTAKPKPLVSMSAAEKDSCDQAIPANFRRNAAGRRLIMCMLDRCLALDVEHNSAKPLFSPGDRLCRLKNCPAAQGLTWADIRNRGPAYMECIWHRARSPEIYGIKVYEEFRKVLQQLQASNRQPFILMIKGICELTQRAL